MTTTEPEWYVDPGGRHDLRYWDGRDWTDHVADAGVAGSDPLPPRPPPAPAVPTTTGPGQPPWPPHPGPHSASPQWTAPAPWMLQPPPDNRGPGYRSLVSPTGVRPLSKLAIWGAICSIIGLAALGVPAAAGIALGIAALVAIPRGGNVQRGTGWAVTAIVLGVVAGAIWITFLVSHL